MMFCQECGRPVAQQSAFCPHCGRRQASAPPSEAAAQPPENFFIPPSENPVPQPPELPAGFLWDEASGLYYQSSFTHNPYSGAWIQHVVYFNPADGQYAEADYPAEYPPQTAGQMSQAAGPVAEPPENPFAPPPGYGQDASRERQPENRPDVPPRTGYPEYPSQNQPNPAYLQTPAPGYADTYAPQPGYPADPLPRPGHADMPPSPQSVSVARKRGLMPILAAAAAVLLVGGLTAGYFLFFKDFFNPDAPSGTPSATPTLSPSIAVTSPPPVVITFPPPPAPVTGFHVWPTNGDLSILSHLACEDGGYVYFSLYADSSTPLCRMNKDGTGIQTIFDPLATEGQYLYTFAPLGDYVYFLMGISEGDGAYAYFRVKKTGGAVEFLFLAEPAFMKTYDGKLYLLLSEARAIGVVDPADPYTLDIREIPTDIGGSIEMPTFFIEGDGLYFVSTDGTRSYLVSVDLKNDYAQTTELPVLLGGGRSFSLAFLEGKAYAFAHYAERSALYVLDEPGLAAKQLLTSSPNSYLTYGAGRLYYQDGEEIYEFDGAASRAYGTLDAEAYCLAGGWLIAPGYRMKLGAASGTAVPYTVPAPPYVNFEVAYQAAREAYEAAHPSDMSALYDVMTADERYPLYMPAVYLALRGGDELTGIDLLGGLADLFDYGETSEVLNDVYSDVIPEDYLVELGSALFGVNPDDIRQRLRALIYSGGMEGFYYMNDTKVYVNSMEYEDMTFVGIEGEEMVLPDGHVKVRCYVEFDGRPTEYFSVEFIRSEHIAFYGIQLVRVTREQ